MPMLAGVHIGVRERDTQIPSPGGATGPLSSDEYDVGSHALSDAKNRIL